MPQTSGNYAISDTCFRTSIAAGSVSIWQQHAQSEQAVHQASQDSSLVSVFGVPIDNVTMDEVMNKVEQWIEEGGFHQIATANTDFLINSIEDEELEEVLSRCDMVIADGMPLVWTSVLKGKRLKERVTGSDMVPRLAELSAREGYSIFLLGSTGESLAGAVNWMETNHPGVRIAGSYSPDFAPLESMDHEAILSRVRAARPDILLVAFGNPKQEKWLCMHRDRLDVPVCIGVGASFDFLAGAVKRAPRWMQQSGLEWAYRVGQEPGRLAGRYVRNALGLARYLPLELAANAAQVKARDLAQLTVEGTEQARVMRIRGNFTGPLVKRFAEQTQRALAAGDHVILDLSASTYVGSDALGLLFRIAARFRFCRRELWLSGLSPWVVRTLRASRSGAQIRTAPKVGDALRRINLHSAVPSVLEFSRDFMVGRRPSDSLHAFRQRGIARSRQHADARADRYGSRTLGQAVDYLAVTGAD